VQIPVALLNQVQETGFDWHIPAFRHELISGLIKSLPKSLRRNFVPAPNYADTVIAAVEPMQGTLLDALTTRLLRMTGVRVDPEAWDLTSLASHLRLHFEVRDEHNKLLARGLDLAKLKAELQGEVTETLSKVADDGIEKADLTQWNFGELPKSYVKKQGQYEIKAYPALVDKKSSAAVELFDNEIKAQIAHQQGLRRLVLLNVPSPIKYLQQNLPNKAKLGLYFNPFGKIADLINDCIAAGVDSLLLKYGDIRTSSEFESVKEEIRGELGDAVVDIAIHVEQVLSIAHALHKKMKGRVDLTMITAHGDIKSQLESLIFKGFVSQHGATKLTDLIRYLKAIQKRLEKLPVDPNRDRVCVLELDKVAAEYKKLTNKIPKGMPIPSEIEAIFWMQQELRVSLFAQTLGTPYPISSKRILNAIKEVE
jgi:ATP-dependent helicase HrpA